MITMGPNSRSRMWTRGRGVFFGGYVFFGMKHAFCTWLYNLQQELSRLVMSQSRRTSVGIDVIGVSQHVMCDNHGTKFNVENVHQSKSCLFWRKQFFALKEKIVTGCTVYLQELWRPVMS